LFFGFGVFTASQFGGTIALGLLVSLTLLIAMASNLILLPSLLLYFDNWLTTKAFKSESIVVLIDEEEDIDLDELEIKEIENS
jgi:predicted RND superfamily exporter protein